MGDIKSKNNFSKSSGKVLIIILSLIILFSIIGVVKAADCCFPPYPSSGDPSFGNDVIILPPGGNCNSLTGYVLVKDCTNDQGNVKSDFLKQDCCCNNSIVQDFGSTSGGYQPYVVYDKYCSAKNLNVVAPTNNVCDCSQSSSSSENRGMHKVTGKVFFNNTPLPGVTVQAENGLFINGITDERGYYDLGNIPGVDNGYNVFTATVPEAYSIKLNSDSKPVVLECPQKTVQKQLSGPYTANVTINFNMTCSIKGPACEPKWVLSNWSACKVYGNQYVKTRTVIDENHCNITTGMPIAVLTATTTGSEAKYYDCNKNALISSCNDGKLEEGELCDKNLTSGKILYRSIPDFKESSNAPTCKEAGFTGDGVITCKNDCTYDYSNCQDICAVCTPENCGICKETCKGSPFCQSSCKNMSVDFLSTYDSSARKSNRNILQSYDKETNNILTGVFYKEGSDSVTIKWSNPYRSSSCENKIIGYKVKYCEEYFDDKGNPTNICKPGTERFELVKQDQEETIIPHILKKGIRSICYNICTLENDGKEDCVFNETAKSDNPMACFAVGDSYCFQPHEPGLNCIYDNVSKQLQPTGCYAENINGLELTNNSLQKNPQDQCGPKQQCIETAYEENNIINKGADCVQAGSCAVCNGFFGLQASQNLESYYFDSHENQGTIYCSQFEFNPMSLQLPSPDNPIARCYMDRREKNRQPITPFQYYDTCEKVKTCYDYKTKRTCENDPCFRFTNVSGSSETNGCEWNVINSDLGIGVCAPKKESAQNCYKCDTNSPTGFCDEKSCEAFGDCYFKTEQHHNQTINVKKEENIFKNDNYLSQKLHQPFLSTCINKKDMACYFYQTEKDCIGADKKNVSIDVHYNESGSPIAGTNKVLVKSDDKFGIGLCKWINSSGDVGCYKDSDNHYSKSIIGANFSDDCFDNPHPNNYDLSCLEDTTPPNTSIILRKPLEQEDYKGHNDTYLPVYGINELNNISFEVIDNRNAPVTTYISILPYEKCVIKNGCDVGVSPEKANSCRKIGCEVYPRYQLKDYETKGSQNHILNHTATKEYEIIYFSEDAAKNLEVLKKNYFMIDLTGPKLQNLTTNISSYKIYGDVYASNLTISFNTSEDSFCETNLTSTVNKSKLLFGIDIANWGKEFNVKYTYLEDGYYNFSIVCNDKFNNKLKTSKLILIEGNAAITNPQPRGEIFKDLKSVIMSIETKNDANCKFDTEPKTYNDSRFTFQKTGDKVHQQNAGLIPGLVSTESKPYMFYTACKFKNGEITEKIPGDVISFTIDNLPPTTTVYAKTSDEENYQPYDMAIAKWNESRDFKLVCNDFNDKIPIVQFGCKEIQYCFAEGKDEKTFTTRDCQSKLFTTNDKETTFTVSYEKYAYDQLYYRSIDKGGNVGPWERTNMKIKNTYYEQPIVYVT